MTSSWSIGSGRRDRWAGRSAPHPVPSGCGPVVVAWWRTGDDHFDLDDDVPEDPKTEIFKAQRLAVDEYGWFTEEFDTADLQEAKALLTDLSAPG
jgi:hypothetical protein